MAQYKVKNPTEELLTQGIALAFNVRYWTNEFRGVSGNPGKMGLENHIQMVKAEQAFDKWIKDNTEPQNKMK